MAYAPFSSNGTVYSLKTATATFSTIKGLVGLAMSGGEFEDVDATAIDDSTPVTLPGAAAARTAEGTIYLDITDTIHQALHTAYEGRTLKTIKAVLADTGNTTRYFDAYVASPLDFPATARNTPGQATLRLQISGAIRNTE